MKVKSILWHTSIPLPYLRLALLRKGKGYRLHDYPEKKEESKERLGF